jgi:Zn-finger nucleic acid-binding protein
MTYRDLEIPCLDCRTRMDTAAGVSICATCGAAWMGVAELLATLRAAHPERAVEELLEHNDGTPRRPCPVCGERMAIVWLEYLQLDQCADHGDWFDPDELQRALDGDVGAHWRKIGSSIEEAKESARAASMPDAGDS